MGFFKELQRRNVLRVGVAYLAFSWLLVQVAETILPAFGFGEAAIRNLVILLAIGLPLTLILSWAFELTPEGLKLERDVERSRSITRQTGKRLDRFVILVLTIGIGFFALDKFLVDPARDASEIAAAREQGRIDAFRSSRTEASIAVLPFADMSAAGDHKYFSDGISEEILNLLARIPELHVTSRTSSFALAERSLDLRQTAELLGVAYILEGSVRRSGRAIRVTAQLIDTATDAHVWSETYDRDMGDVFVIQDDIAASVTESIHPLMAADLPTAIPTDPAVFTMYLQARHRWRQGDPTGVRAAFDILSEATRIDPGYAPAWEGLSTVYTYLVDIGDMAFEEGYDEARKAAVKALELDPGNAAALSHLGWDAMAAQGDLHASAAYFGRALDMAPNNPTVLGNTAILLAMIGRTSDATKLLTRAIDQDPVDAAKFTNLGALEMVSGRYEEAETALERALGLSPGDVWAERALVYLHVLQGRAPEASALIDESDDASLRLKCWPMILHEQGRSEELSVALLEMEDSVPATLSPFDVAEVYANLERPADAYRWLDNALESGESLIQIRLSPFFPKIASGPEWTRVLSELGVADDQVSDIKIAALDSEPGG